MKKNKNSTLTARQSEGILRNAHAMSRKSQKKYRAILMVVIQRVIKAKLGFDFSTSDGNFLSRSEAIAAALAADAGGYFTVPFSQLALLVTQNTALDAAIQDVKLGVMGGEGAKLAAKAAVKVTLGLALAYVNGIAVLDQTNANEIITSASMMVIGAQERNKQDFAIKQSEDSGSIILRSLAAKVNSKRVKAIYYWQYSLTPNDEASFISLSSTVDANTVAEEMPTDKKVWFRKRITTKKGGTSDWCAPLGISPI